MQIMGGKNKPLTRQGSPTQPRAQLSATIPLARRFDGVPAVARRLESLDDL